MKLYLAPGACSLAPHIALEEAGLPHELVKVDLVKHTLADGTDYRSVNPKGYVPFLKLDDGSALSEAGVILQYIADRKPGTIAPVFGTSERWKLMEWLNFIATEIHKAFSPLWNPQTSAELRERSVQGLGNRFSLIEKTLAVQPYLTGQQFTVADAYLFTVVNWSGMLKVDLTPWPALVAFQQRVAARPAVQRAMKSEGLIK